MQIQPSSYLWVRFGGWEGEGGAGQHNHEGKGELGIVGGLPTPLKYNSWFPRLSRI